MSNTPHPTDTRHLWFRRAGLRFAASMEYLQEVLNAPPLRPLPGAEPALAGLMRLREHILPVLDPWSLTTSRPGRAPETAVIIVLALSGKPVLGLLAETVGKVVQLPSPSPLAKPARIPNAFAGQCRSAGQSRLFVFDVPTLAAGFGLTPSVAADSK